MYGLACQISFDPDPGRQSRRLGEILREAIRAGAELWVEEHLPIHFTHAAAARYGYRARTKGTIRRKLRKGKQPVHLVDTGEAKEEVLSSAPAGIKAYPNRAVITLQAPPYVRQTPRANQPDMLAEIAAVIPSEQHEIERAMQAEAEKRLAQAGDARTVLIS